MTGWHYNGFMISSQDSNRGSISRLFLSPGHNFFGRYGKPPGEHPVVAVEEVECVRGRGLRGDRFFDFKPDYKGQITFFETEVLLRMWEELGVPAEKRDPGATRRNALTVGVSLTDWIGVEFELQGVRFQGMEESRPCEWMETAIGAGAMEWMRGRGGLRAKILSDGKLRVDHPQAIPGDSLLPGGLSQC